MDSGSEKPEQSEKGIENSRVSSQRFLIGALIFQILLAVLYIAFGTEYLFRIEGLRGDEPSYLNFNWSSLKEILGSHRSFGLPLILSIWSFFDAEFWIWPFYQMVLYFSSILFLCHSMLRWKVSAVFTLFFCSFLIWHTQIYVFFKLLVTEVHSAALTNVLLGLFLRYSRRGFTWKTCAALGGLIFLTYQIRTALAFIPLVAPFLVVFLSMPFLRDRFELFNRFLRMAVVSFLPLLLFLFLRLAVVGEFGLVSLNGVLLSGHATAVFEEKHLSLMEGDTKKLGQIILIHRTFIDPPCMHMPNLDLSDYEYIKAQRKCYGLFVMSNWIGAIGILEDDYLFRYNTSQNATAYNYVTTLSTFFNRYNVEIDRLLMDYSKTVLGAEFWSYLRWVQYAPIIVLSMGWKAMKDSVVIPAILILACFLVAPFLGRKIPRLTFPDERKPTQIFVLVVIGYFLASALPVILINTVLPRFFVLVGLYSAPLCIALLAYFFCLYSDYFYFKLKFSFHFGVRKKFR